MALHVDPRDPSSAPCLVSGKGNDELESLRVAVPVRTLTEELAHEVDQATITTHEPQPSSSHLSGLQSLAEIDVPRRDVASNRGLIGLPLTLARRATLRLLRPFFQKLMTQVTSFNRAAVEALSDEGARRAHDIETVRVHLATQLQGVRSDLDAVRSAVETGRHQIAQLETFASALDERLMPTIFTVSSLRTIDDAGRSTIGFSGDVGVTTSPYEAFEAAFRGPRERVSDLLESYLPAFDECQHVLDAGCGRGEFIEMLGDRGVRATGVDLDGGMLHIAIRNDLDVHQADAGEWLRENPGVYDGLFSSQVVEHLTFQELASLLSAAVSFLRPSSVVIIETVNPYCAAGLQAFRTDPTHTALVFPEVLAVMAQASGFARAAVTFPCEWSLLDSARRTSPSYALVARTPEG